ncbi:hypothetical protein D3C71_1643970 [compost metagenome]
MHDLEYRADQHHRGDVDDRCECGGEKVDAGDETGDDQSEAKGDIPAPVGACPFQSDTGIGVCSDSGHDRLLEGKGEICGGLVMSSQPT